MMTLRGAGMRVAALTTAVVYAATAVPSSVNMNGFTYIVANNTGGFSGNFSQINMQNYGSNNYFEVYSPLISTVYGQVYWTIMDPVPLPDDIIKKFAGKMMAITGYESDQVLRTPQGDDVPLPITAAYNHHYTGYVVSAHAKLIRVKPEHPERVGHMTPDGLVPQFVDRRGEGSQGDGVSVALHEGNGGESRQSYHGYPKGYAQMVKSPVSFQFQPMQIDTWNRDNKHFDGFVPGPLPANSESLPNATYSGLLECPCTTRITKLVNGAVQALGSGTCAKQITDSAACLAAAQHLNPGTAVVSAQGANASMPPGCSLLLNAPPAAAGHNGRPVGPATAFYNTLAVSPTTCGGSTPSSLVRMHGEASPEVTGVANLGVWIEVEGPTLRIIITGPADVWFGIGLNTSTMAGNPYTIVVDGNGNVTERSLGDHSPGTLLTPTLTVESHSVNSGRRSVIVSRPIAASAGFLFSVDGLRTNPQLPIIAAVGSSGTFGYHQSKGSSDVQMFLVGAPTCLCDGGATMPFGQGAGFLMYTPPAGEPGSPGSSVPGANFTKLGFKKDCRPYPTSTMLLGKNPSCDLRAYTGGQSCCHHLITLLDKDQQTPWPDQPLEYYYKWRIYYQDVDASGVAIDNLVKHNWGGMATPTEYDVPQCEDGVEGCSFEDGHWVHRMNGTWTVGDMVPGQINFEPVTIHGHCHAPTCLEFTLYNADTSEVICQQKPVHGQSNATFDEEGYISVPPCVFGSAEEGFQPFISLPPSTRLFSTKTCRADVGHHGEMSLWQTYCKQ